MASWRKATIRGLIWSVALLGGCSALTKVSFDLPAQTFSFDTASLNLPAVNTVAVPCGSGQTVSDCCHPPAPLPAPDCTATPLVCEPNDQQTNVCTAEIPASQSSTVMLKSQVGVLQSVSSIANITVSQIRYTVTDNTLSVDVPATKVYLAPNGVMDPSDGRAKLFGTMRPIPKMTTLSDMLMLAPDANATFASFAHDLSTPFNVIAQATVKVPSGSSTPTGAITIVVTGTLSASL